MNAVRAIIRRLRKGPPDDHTGAYGYDAQMTADGLEALADEQRDLADRVRALEGCMGPTGEPGKRPG